MPGLIRAYKIHGYDFIGPDWLQSERFDFSAKIPTGTSKEDFQKMVANLLVERFKMAAHRETRQVQGYEMTVVKNGPKFKESIPKETSVAGPAGTLARDADGFPILRPGMSMGMVSGHARVQSEDRPMVCRNAVKPIAEPGTRCNWANRKV